MPRKAAPRRPNKATNKATTKEQASATPKVKPQPLNVQKKGKAPVVKPTRPTNKADPINLRRSKRIANKEAAAKPSSPAAPIAETRDADTHAADTSTPPRSPISSAAQRLTEQNLARLYQQLRADHVSTVSSSGAPAEQPADDMPSRAQLICRNIWPDPLEDLSFTNFIADLKERKEVEINFSDTLEIQNACQNFLHKAQDASKESNAYPSLQDFFRSLEETKARRDVLPISRKSFKQDQEYAAENNEAIFQRTAMMEVFNRWRVHDSIFAYSSEVQWKVTEMEDLPAREGSLVSVPRPDLLFSFKGSALISQTGGGPLYPPASLELTMDPEASGKRCFPFLVIEAKQAWVDLEAGSFANMYRAAQLLSNMHKWFEEADQYRLIASPTADSYHLDHFFDEVRVFSFVLTAKIAVLNIHRAHRDPHGKIGGYSFQQIYSEDNYHHDRVGRSISHILEYAKDKLLKQLKAAYNEVTSGYEKRLGLGTKKRAATSQSGRKSKRSKACPTMQTASMVD